MESMIEQLKKVPNIHIYLTTFEHPKAIELSNVSDLVDDKVSIVSLWQFGLAEILEKMTDEDALVVTGSLYFISDVRNLLLQLEEMMNYKSVIFDMDGLLFDTEIVYYEATQVVADRFGFPYDKELYLKF